MILSSVPTLAALLAVLAVLAYVLGAVAAAHPPVSLRPIVVQTLLVAAWALHGIVVALGLLGVGEGGPHFGFGPALSATAWLVLTVYGIESRLLPQLRAHWVLALLGALTVLVGLLFPGTPMHVSASVWLPLHSALGIASYGLFAAAVVHAWLTSRVERQMRETVQSAPNPTGLPLLTLERLTFRFVEAGFILLTATLLAGWWFGETLYGPGKAWKLDHKTVFSVLAWATFACLLVGRLRFGWRGTKAVRLLYTGSGLLLLAYVGSRFVLEVILRRPV